MTLTIYTLLNFSTHSAICNAGALDPRKVKGKILVCLREYNDNARTEKSQQADIAGAAGMILVNDEQSGNDIVADPHVLPVSHLNYTDGKHVFDYIKSTKSLTPSLNYLYLNFVYDRRSVLISNSQSINIILQQNSCGLYNSSKD